MSSTIGTTSSVSARLEASVKTSSKPRGVPRSAIFVSRSCKSLTTRLHAQLRTETTARPHQRDAGIAVRHADHVRGIRGLVAVDLDEVEQRSHFLRQPHEVFEVTRVVVARPCLGTE